MRLVRRTWLGLRAFLSADVSAAGLVGPEEDLTDQQLAIRRARWLKSAQFARVRRLAIIMTAGAIPALALRSRALLPEQSGIANAVDLVVHRFCLP